MEHPTNSQSSPTARYADRKARIFIRFMLVYLLTLIFGWLNGLGQPAEAGAALDPGRSTAGAEAASGFLTDTLK